MTSLSLAPGQELLATTHANRKGIYLWANQYIFSGAADIVPSEAPVDARLPAIAAGKPLASCSMDAGQSQTLNPTTWP